MFVGFKVFFSWYFVKRRYGGFFVGFEGVVVVIVVFVVVSFSIIGFVVYSFIVIFKEKVDYKYCRCYYNF